MALLRKLVRMGWMTGEQYLKGVLAAYAILGGHRGDDIAGQWDAPENCFFSAVFGWKEHIRTIFWESYLGHVSPDYTVTFPCIKRLPAPLC